MPFTLPSLFNLVGRGFSDDAYAADGNHLRWVFDPALGFSRFPFCLERRISVSTKPGQPGVDVRSASLRDVPGGTYRFVRGDVTVTRDPHFVGFGGIIPVADDLPPVDIRFGGAPRPYAAWAQVQIQLNGPSHATVEAYHDAAGELRLVDQASTRFRPFDAILPRSPRLAGLGRLDAPTRSLRSLLERPTIGESVPELADRGSSRVYKVLVEHDPERYSRVDAQFLLTILDSISEARIPLENIWQHLPKTRIVSLDVFGDRIDFVRVTGHSATVVGVTWALAESLTDAEWETVGCYSALTDEPDYVKRNINHLPPGPDIEGGTEARLAEPLPNGAEPMDDPQVPPSRPPTLEERMKRYGYPWLERLEPWMELVLAESLGGATHMSEVAISEPLTEFGQKPGDGIPELPEDVPDIDQQTQTIHPYGMLLAASMAFPTAQLMGLATIDTLSAEEAAEVWDYRITGIWLVEDLEAYRAKLRDRLEQAQAEMMSSPPARMGEAVGAVIQAFNDFATGAGIVNALIGGADAQGRVTLTGYAGGLSLNPKTLFAAPDELDVSFHELASPSDHISGSRRRDRAVAHLEWPISERRSQIGREMPMLATLARRNQGSPQPFDRVLNSIHPDFGVAGSVVPLDSEPNDAGRATADYFDRDVVSGVDYTYGVTQSDLFGRWSRFTESDFSWIYDIPPPPPLGVTAELVEDGSPPLMELRIGFRWPTDLYPADEHEFSLFLERSPLPNDGLHDPAEWDEGLRRTDSAPAPPFRFAGDFSGSTTHDGMPVTVSFNDETETDPAGIDKRYRNYVVAFRGLVLDRTDELAVCWAGVRSHDVSGIDGDEVAGPARADHYDPNPPPPPAWPPEPLQASFADADGLSTFELTWSARSDSVYEVFRAGERDLIGYLSSERVDVSSYDRDDPPNVRAAALKALAANEAARKVFTRRSELEAGDDEYVDSLPGYASTLYLYVVLTRSPSGVASAWPTGTDAFLAVEVPRAPLPDRPVVRSALWVEGDPAATVLGEGDLVELAIAEPVVGTAEVAAYEVYRTKSADKAKDLSTMRLLHRLHDPVFTEIPGEVGETIYVDPHIEPWSTYYYRVVARAPGNVDGMGTRSAPSAPLRITTLGSEEPTPPTIDSATRNPDGSVQIAISAEAHTTPAGDFVFDVLTSTTAGARRHVTVRADSARVSTDAYVISFDDSGVTPGSDVQVRMTTPLGRSALSPATALPPL